MSLDLALLAVLSLIGLWRVQVERRELQAETAALAARHNYGRNQ